VISPFKCSRQANQSGFTFSVPFGLRGSTQSHDIDPGEMGTWTRKFPCKDLDR